MAFSIAARLSSRPIGPTAEFLARIHGLLGSDETYAYVRGEGSPGAMLQHLLIRVGSIAEADLALLMARQLVREAPGEAKDAVLSALIAGDNALAVLLIPEVSGYLGAEESERAFNRVVADALRPVDPYAPGSIGDSARATADLLAGSPLLLEQLDKRIASASDTTKRIAGDLAVSALALGRNLGPNHVARIAPWLGKSFAELASAIAMADSRYSVADPLGPPRKPAGLLRHLLGITSAATGTYPARMAGVGVLSILLVVVATALVWRLPSGVAIAASEAMTAAAVVIALHVLAVELAATKLPTGFVARVAWPVRLVAAYAALAISVSCSLLAPSMEPKWDRLLLACAGGAFVAFLLLFPVVVKDLVGKADTLTAVRRIARDREFDMWLAARASGRTFQARKASLAAITTLPSLVKASSEPASRRHLRITATADGYATLDVAQLTRLDGWLRIQQASDGAAAPQVALLTQDGNEVRRGEGIAAVVADEPEVAATAGRMLRRAVKVRPIRPASRSKGAVRALSQGLQLQAAERDLQNADKTSQRIVSLLRTYLLAIHAVTVENGYLEHFLPMTPEQTAAEGWESAYGSAIRADDDAAVDFLRRHALRLGDLAREFEYSACLEVLLARAGVLASSVSPDGAHSVAVVVADLARVAAETGRRPTYGAARLQAQRSLQELSRSSPIPRVEQLCRQRFEELLAYGLVGDYFLETDVFRGSEVLSDLGAGATPERQAQIHLGICRLGGLALSSRRYGLAVQLAEMLIDAGVDWKLIQGLAKTEMMSSRLTVLSSLAGDIFGGDPVGSVVRYTAWAEEVAGAVA